MKFITAAILIFMSTSLYAAGGARFWVEPQASHVINGNFDNGSVKGETSGYGGGLQAFGFFTSNLYLGVAANHVRLNVESLKPANLLENVDGYIFSAGPVLGCFFARFRLWGTYRALDQLKQEHNNFGSSTKIKNTFNGSGWSAGLSFWVWNNFAIGAEYFQHTFKEDQSGALITEQTVSTTNIMLSFPFEIFK